MLTFDLLRRIFMTMLSLFLLNVSPVNSSQIEPTGPHDISPSPLHAPVHKFSNKRLYQACLAEDPDLIANILGCKGVIESDSEDEFEFLGLEGCESSSDTGFVVFPKSDETFSDTFFIKSVIKNYDSTSQQNLLSRVSEVNRLEVAYELGFYDILRTQFRPDSVISRNKHFKYIVESDISCLFNFEKLLFASIFDNNLAMIKSIYFLFPKRSKLEFLIYSRLQPNSFGCTRFHFHPSMDLTSLEAACLSGNIEIVKFIIEIYRKAGGLRIENSPAVWAAKSGAFHIVDYILNYPHSYIDPKSLLHYSLESRNDTFISKIMKLDIVSNLKYDSKLCSTAARQGHLEIVKTCHNTGIEFDHDVLIYAAVNGHLNLVQFLLSNYQYQTNIVEEACRCAVYSGHLNILEHFHRDSSALYLPNEKLADVASEHGHIHIVKYLMHNHDIHFPRAIPSDKGLCSAALKGHFDILKLFPHRYHNLSQEALDMLPASGDIHLVKKLVEDSNVVLTSSAINHAAAAGHLEMVKYLCDRGIAVDNYSINEPTKKKNIEVIDELLKRGAVPSNDSIIISIQKGNDEILGKFLEVLKTKNKLKKLFKTGETFRKIISVGNLRSIQLLIVYNSDFKKQFACEKSLLFEFGFFDIIKYFKEILGIIQFDKYDMFLSIKNGNLEIVKYLHSSGVDYKFDRNEFGHHQHINPDVVAYFESIKSSSAGNIQEN